MVLEAIGERIWLTEGEIVNFYGFPYSTRAVIAALNDGGLWVWSPIALTPALRAEIDRLGAVTHLVSPNKLHHLYLQDWKAAYPGALLWGPRSTIQKRKDLTFRKPLENLPPSEWAELIDQAWFRGSPFMDEVVFFHKPSATAILADLSENFSEDFLRNHWRWWQRWLAWLDGITEANGYAPLEWRLSFIDRRPARAALRKMLDWNPRAVVIAHGVWQRENGRAYLERVFRWLGS
jgi:hypothetical protein